MTLQEVYQKSKDGHRDAVRTALKKGVSLEELDCLNVTELYIFHDYTGEIPDISLFPKLVTFSSNVILTPEYLERQNLTAITRLRITLDNGSGSVRIVAPNLLDLDVYIRNNEDDQLSMFQSNVNVIDISRCAKLRSLKLSHTTGYEVLTDGIINSVNSVVIEDMRTCDFQFLRNFPCARNLTLWNSGCQDISFVHRLIHLESVDLRCNEIEDISSLADLPKLQSVNIYQNNVRDVSCLKNRLCEVYVTEEDNSFLSFKRSVYMDIMMGYSYVQHCRKPNSRRGKFWDEVYAKKTDEELFLNYFRAKLKEEVDNYTVDAKKHYHTPVPISRLTTYIKTEFPFINYVFPEQKDKEK